MSGTECKQKQDPVSDWFKKSKDSNVSWLNLGLRPVGSFNYSVSDKNCKQKTDSVSDWFKNSKGSHESMLNLSLRPPGRYSYSSSSSSPSWSPYWSHTTTSQTGVPFSWEERPGVPKNQKSPTLAGCFGENSLSIPSEFSVVETFQVERRSKKKADDADPFVSAFVGCTEKPVAAINGQQGRRGKPGSPYLCSTSCTINADALIVIPARVRKLSRQKNSNMESKERKNQKSCSRYKSGKD